MPCSALRRALSFVLRSWLKIMADPREPSGPLASQNLSPSSQLGSPRGAPPNRSLERRRAAYSECHQPLVSIRGYKALAGPLP
jgi:hypothetical protein